MNDSDRRDVNSLHGNYRDASRAGVWNQKPTPILTPSTQNQSWKHSDPYSRRLQSNSLGSYHGRATTAHEPKRRKLEPAKSSTSYIVRPSNSGRRHLDSYGAPEKFDNTAQEVIDVDRIADEDTGEPVRRHQRSRSSSDPINFIASAPPPAAAATVSRYRPGSGSSSLPYYPPTRTHVEEGDSTKRVREELRRSAPREDTIHDEDRDSVESASGFDDGGAVGRAHTPSRTTQFPRVQKKIESFNQEHQSVRITDLKTLPVQSRMKPRETAVLNRLSDPLTAPSGFASKGRASAFAPTTVVLPLSAWAVGMVNYKSEVVGPVTLHWSTRDRNLCLRSSEHSVAFKCTLNEEAINTLMIVPSQNLRGDPTAQLSFTTHVSITGHYAHAMQAGTTRPGGLLTVTFDTKATEWNPENYERLCTFLRQEASDVQLIDEPGAKALWEALWNAVDLSNRRDQRHNDSMDVDEQSPKASKPRARPAYQGTAKGKEPVRRSVRLSGQTDSRVSPAADPDEMHVFHFVLILGCRFGTGSLNIKNSDLVRLGPGEFLNDTLIEFGLKLWWADLQETNPKLADQIHVFNSFFYKKLSNKNPDVGYESVRKWTAKFDIFQKKYIIVPINENVHWYLAIIYLPEHVLRPPPISQTSIAARRSTRHLETELAEDGTDEGTASTSVILSRNGTPPPEPVALAPSRSVSVVPETPECSRAEESAVENLISFADATALMTSDHQRHISTEPGEIVDFGELLDFESMDLEYPQSFTASPAAHPIDLSENTDTEKRRGASSSTDPRPASLGVPPARFYGSSSAKGSSRATSIPDREGDVEDVIGVEPIDVSDAENAPVDQITRIYTFDSLSARHPQAIKRLARYLQLEAHDKKGKSIEETTEPKGKQALVPHQPNYCDCGIYLLHFAKTFMKDPALSSRIINQTNSPKKGRKRPHDHWDGASVGSYREELSLRIQSMSDAWKKDKEEQKKREDAEREASGEKDPIPVMDSDSDIEVVQTIEHRKAAPLRKATAAARLR
ncbi:hypothetical protein FA95DRAFT_1676228 [Auriscalpium vulgare]|uniref:Uncharacterized protein n=1 Tax=Auriscalpium vulgare TaxID=40419 RepID=A0ACB8S4M3_9AGAM|nr:hypothetical protein FA95DRAFT_1676228 [Auriscalpium vulgare]